MSHTTVDSILSATAYNRLIIDHKATECAEFLELKRKHLPTLFQILAAHGVTEFVEPHLLHRHFLLREGEAVVHRTLEVPGPKENASICVDIAKAMSCPESIKSSLVPLLWMASSNGTLIAYEYGLREWAKSPKQAIANISSQTWNSFAQEFAIYVHSAGVADIVSLKDKSCVNGGEYVVSDMRVLFRVPTEVISLQPGSGMLESGWKLDTAVESDANFPECTDGHLTKTRETTGGTVAHYHKTTEDGVDAFNPKEVPLPCTNAMWAAAKSDNFWVMDNMVNSAA
ncbi:hypothetical protein O1611_g8011 [Lasiodiplodia mahajangana]|uniref:Uncharacterized protein n=1 Tax=Lasiodiplodia mahajangana TaxID=1108764 RepID=A0ACC2JE06_9PEZI|nr:hypothetical protein O1611_g8011 [Lasiodiplodia mahajangana]